MHKFVFIFVTFVKIHTSVASFEPSSADFCKLKCDEEENSACNCRIFGRRSENLTDLVVFRKRILKVHNHFRNNLASGKLGKSEKASNMNVLSYSVELEYAARCYGLKYVFYNSMCSSTPTFAKPGQIIGRFGEKVDINKIAVIFENLIQHELEYVTNDTIDSYVSVRPYQIEEFAQMSWWSNTHLGCARVYNPDFVLKMDKYVVVCYYGGTQKAAVVGEPMYKKGEPCSQCANNTKCSASYPNLCGVMEAVSNETAYPINSSKMGGGGTGMVVLLGVFLRYFV